MHLSFRTSARVGGKVDAALAVLSAPQTAVPTSPRDTTHKYTLSFLNINTGPVHMMQLAPTYQASGIQETMFSALQYIFL